MVCAGLQAFILIAVGAGVKAEMFPVNFMGSWKRMERHLHYFGIAL